jgi:hypothetical protein
MTNETLALAIVPTACTALTVYNPIVIEQPQPNGSAADDAELTQLIAEARNCWLHGRARRLALGDILLKIHRLKAKPGCGSFIRTVEDEVGMPYTTAKDYMRDALLERHNGIRNFPLTNGEPNSEGDNLAVNDAEVTEPDLNDGTPDEVEQAKEAYKKKLLEALQREKQPERPRDFNWKFVGISLALSEELKAAKAKLGSINAAHILINAAKEVSNELIAA